MPFTSNKVQDSPIVTIGLPIYNAERYLTECINSIKTQTFENYRVIAVLDAPTDQSEHILRELADSRFCILKNERNKGLVANLNLMLERTTTPLFARMDADDIMLSNRIECQVNHMISNPEIDVLATLYDKIDECGNITKETAISAAKNKEIVETYRNRSVIHHPTVMFRTERIREIGGYDPEYPYAEDIALWLKCFTRGYVFEILPLELLHYRVHSKQLMSSHLEQTCDLIDKAYATYGRAIWGELAPNYVAGVNKWHRLRRRIKKVVKKILG